MEQYVGLDVSLKETHFCVVDEAGVELVRGREVTQPELLAAALARHAPAARVVVLETGGPSMRVPATVCSVSWRRPAFPR